VGLFARCMSCRKQTYSGINKMAIKTDSANLTDSAGMTRYPCTIARQISKPGALLLVCGPRDLRAIEPHRTSV
jgi:hypothetical protein